jgi:hypothetical protein
MLIAFSAAGWQPAHPENEVCVSALFADSHSNASRWLSALLRDSLIVLSPVTPGQFVRSHFPDSSSNFSENSQQMKNNDSAFDSDNEPIHDDKT